MHHMDVPMEFFECVGWWQATRIIISHALVVFLYWYISLFRFVPAAKHARTRTGRVVWWSIACIFPFCATSGYFTTILAGWYPAIAYPAKEWMSHVDVIACVVFVVSTRKQTLQAVGDDQYKHGVEAILAGKHTTDKEIVQRIRDLSNRVSQLHEPDSINS